MLKVIFSNNTLTQFQSNISQILNLMNPVSVKIGTYLDRYTAKVTLEHEGRYDETSMEILSKGARLKEAFCATCDVFVYDLDEKSNPDKCYMFKKPTSYECSAYPDRIRVEIEFGELHHGPNIDEKCKEGEKLRYRSTVMRKLMKEDLDKKFNDKGDDNVSAELNRISKHEYYLKIAEAVSLRGTCLRRKFGSIIVKDDRIVSTGYVGAPRGRINCCDRGTCFRIEHNIPSGEAYHKCRSTHAEMNAVIQASPEEMKDATLYLVGIENDGSYTNADCCTICKRIIINSGIKNVIARQADGSYTDTPIQSWIDDDDTLDIDHKGY